MSFDTPNPTYSASDPYATFLNASCFEHLLIELVPLAERMARRLEESIDGQQRGGPVGGTGAASGTATATTTGGGSGATGTGTGTSAEKEKVEQDDERFRDAVYFRLESLGYRVGQGLSERFSRDRPRFTDNLDVIKFICKDLWTIVFKKQIDNLKTNHRGVYVLTDNTFRPFARMSMANRTEALIRAQTHLFFPAGIIRGALASLGIEATVQAETTELPQATFQIKTMPSKV